MILNVKPVTDVAAVSVYGNRTPVQNPSEAERDQFLGKMKGPIVIGAIAGRDLKTVCVLIGMRQMIACGFAS